MTAAFTAEAKYKSTLLDFERRFALPLVEIAQHLLTVMRERDKRGIGAAGPMAPLGAYNTSAHRFWAHPKRSHPTGPGFVGIVEHGALKGWAIYSDYRAYAQLLGHGAPRDLEATGKFWASLAVRVLSGSRVKVAPYGSHVGPDGQRLPNTTLGYLASRREPLPLLYPTADEVRQAARIVFDKVSGDAIEASAIAGLGGTLSRQAASVQRRASKLLGD